MKKSVDIKLTCVIRPEMHLHIHASAENTTSNSARIICRCSCAVTAPYRKYYMSVDHQVSQSKKITVRSGTGPVLLLFYSLGPGISY